MIKYASKLRIDWEAVGLMIFSFLLVATVIFVLAYSFADTHYGTTVTGQMTVVDMERVRTNPKIQSYSYYADLLEDGQMHSGVSFAHSHWRQLTIGRTYRMTCIEGYYTKRLTSCAP